MRLGGDLDALGDDRQPERPGQRDDRLGHRATAVGQLGDERAVDLQLVHREVLQVGERGVPDAEVVDRDAHADRAQAQQRLPARSRVRHHRRLRDLQAQRGRGQAVPGEGVGHGAEQAGVAQLQGGQVDVHPPGSQVTQLAAPAGKLCARGVEHVGGQP